MFQAKLPIINVSLEKKKRLEDTLKEIFLNVKTKFKDINVFQEILCKPTSALHSKYIKDEQLPEPFTCQHMIEPLLELLGYEITTETQLYAPTGRKAPDYVIRPKEKDEPLFYVEAESLNSDLKGKKEGIAQVRSWLISRASKTDYGLATDGLQWFLLKFDSASTLTKIMLKVDLRPIFIKLQNSAALVTQDEISNIKKDFLYLDEEYISSFLREKLETIEIHKNDISQKFYNDYVKNVFGYDKSGNQILGTCLLNKIDPPLDTPAHDKNLFAVVFMNRLIFTKFLEEKGIVPKDFLKKLLTKYKSLALPSTFYQTYLKPLFYEVFNKGEINRREEIRNHQIFKNIPYLNGGLFNEVVNNESIYNVGNDGIELVINNLLNEYDFGSDSVIDPDILGLHF